MRATSLVPLSLRFFILVVSLFFSFQAVSFGNKHNLEKSQQYVKDGTSYFGTKKFHEALASFQMALHYNKSPDLHFHIAQCEMELGDYKSALENYLAYRKHNPQSQNAKLVESRILEAKQHLGLIPTQTINLAKVPPMNLRPRSQLNQLTPRQKTTTPRTAEKKDIPSVPAPPPLPALELLGGTTNEPALLPLVPNSSKEADTQTRSSATPQIANANQPLNSLAPRKAQATNNKETTSPSKEGSPTDSTAIVSAPLDVADPTPRNFSVNSDSSHLLFESAPEEQPMAPVYKKWWFWSVTGSVLAASVGAIMYATNSESEPVVVLPTGSLGRIDRR